MKHRKFISFLFIYSLILLLLAGFQRKVQAQEKVADGTQGENAKSEATSKQEVVQRIVNVKYALPDDIANVLMPVVGFRGGRMHANGSLKVITLVGTAENVAYLEQAIRQLDVPSPPALNIELIAYLLVASDQETAKELSPDLEGVIKQLKNVFPYSSFRLLDTLMVRCRDGKEGEATGVAPTSAGDRKDTFYSFRFGAASVVNSPGGRMIRINGLRLGVKVPVYVLDAKDHAAMSYIDTGINTDIDVREGQKVVVGKSTIDGSENALFLVLSAKVVD